VKSCENVLVSVVVPVYNVKRYLERCLKSLNCQTHSELEIILVNDGSTDGSDLICKEWVKKDHRIVLINQENRGLGEARNTGVTSAKGKYLAFVDSDDWVQPDYIKCMLTAAEEHQAELIICNYQKVYELINEGFYLKPEKMKLTAESELSSELDGSLLFYTGTLVWNKLYLRSWMLEIGIKQPSNAVEDMCVSFVYAAKAKKIIHVNKVLYNYYQREASLISGDKAFNHLWNTLDIVKRNADTYLGKGAFAYEIKKIVSDGIVYYEHLNKEKSECGAQVERLKNRFTELYDEYGYDGCDSNLGESIAFGSFNLRCMVKELCYFIPDYYGFSSLIAALDDTEYNLDVCMNNSFRKFTLQKELQKTFIKKIKDTNVLLIDFLEERFGILATEQAGIITNSEAFKDWNNEDIIVTQKLDFQEIEFIRQWKKSIKQFKDIINRVKPDIKIVLVKTRLAEYFGQFGKENDYPDKQVYQRLNEQLVCMENYFMEQLPQTVSVDLPVDLCYTDEDYEYGCYPWHLNGFCYKEMAKQIRKLLLEH
jgi:Glycosyltransferases, probably involved in cell wall biogenesis